MSKSLLDGINSPDDIKKLNIYQLTKLSDEIRNMLIDVVSKNGGHLASNLGVVELTIAIHKIFDCPKDQIVFDVGHQSYTHKILTKRKARFDTLRKKGGISGFPKSSESEYDAFIAGHSSTSISAACGLASAKRLKGDDGYVVAVIGDGALTGGLAFVGLNNAARANDKIIIVLNDNEMSISKNVGALARYLALIRSSKNYFNLKDKTEEALSNIPLIGENLVKSISWSKDAFKQLLYHSNFFEDLGFQYMGPVDGHNIENLCDVLQRAKDLARPVLVHVDTKKGKGYGFAENNPGAYHGTSNFDIIKGSPELPSEDSFSNIFGKYITEMAEKDERICAVTAAMKYGTGLHHFSARFKNDGRFYDVGIAESHAVTFCAGLAANGMIPVFAVYSTFLQRAVDQVIHDASIEKKHIILAVDRAGIVGDDGETHQGVFDVPLLSCIPEIAIYSPANYEELKYSLNKAVYDNNGVCVVRYPRGPQIEYDNAYAFTPDEFNFINQQGNNQTIIVTYGRIYGEVCKAHKLLEEEKICCGILRLNKIAPIPEDAVKILSKFNNIFFVEESIQKGAIGEQLLFL
ncbi:MAG TPA: 1-deoxy-D-xylulose-5-phosphate synthase, partial [Ruminococcaceae bacterium]|nr:1-deoxy-D-xylulose-5-phosphate synthase [Oscillospiraceae bacterium]